VPVERLWVAELLISERTAAKIRGLHRVQPEDVRDAVVCVERLPYVWDEDEQRGRRAIIRVTIGGRVMDIVLYPVVNHPMGDVYHLGSAYPLE
jgi:hypothetical protein